MEKNNIVFIAKSIDGYIADKNGSIEWLHAIPNPDNNDMGYNQLIDEIDAIVMGRTTYETVLSFDIPWPYSKPVFVLSNTLKEVPKELSDKVFLLQGDLKEILSNINKQGYLKLYIDGGQTIQQFFREDLIDELRITTIPILLGGGFSLFGDLPNPIELEHIKSTVYLNQIVQDCYRRRRK